MNKTVVINAVGLTPNLIGANTPNLKRFMDHGKRASVTPPIPAVTCTVQSTYLTGAAPRDHGIVCNGWYFRDECEVRFWRQSNKLVQRPKIWEVAKQRDPKFTCANLFWWYAMYSAADYTVTPRPMYPADGRKIPDVWTHPAHLRLDLQEQLGPFPLFQFWGPATSINSTRWIADASVLVDRQYDPTLTLIYLPHLDYELQRSGPSGPAAEAAARELDGDCGKLLDYFASHDARIIILSEYGITPVSRPVHLNRLLRAAGLLAVRNELGHEVLDAGASAAFAVADHQIAQVYVNDLKRLDAIKKLLQSAPGVSRVLDTNSKRDFALDHPRAGELICLAEPDSWFTYYYWLDEARAPDFARTVDIHRKPGYDPVELLLDPKIASPKLKIAYALAKRKLGMRSLMEVISLDATLVKGSHGLPPASAGEGPMVATNYPNLLEAESIDAKDVFQLILRHLDLLDPNSVRNPHATST
jgi:predicted AlkP superfamily pyrophosphatase or phosphodiesterase